jgi:hypothetical protein
MISETGGDQLFYGVVPMTGYYSEEQRLNDRNAFITRLLENASG